MDFEATVHLVLPVVKGQGARGEWTKQEVVFELAQDQYNRKICVGFWNDKAPAAAALRVGERVLVSVNIESRERNGRWFTEARGWKFTLLNNNGMGSGTPMSGGYDAPMQGGYSAPASAPMAAPSVVASQPVAEEYQASHSAADDLPF
ncbi:MAG: DUF3127 domain-containing protein [Mucinivorans sp.]